MQSFARHIRRSCLSALSLLISVSAFGCASSSSASDSESEEAMSAASIGPILASMGGKPCEGHADYTCLDFPVPLDHANPDGEHIAVRFAVRPASGVRKGMLVTVAGGPGDPGVDAIYDYAKIDKRFPAEFDLVFFDLRGVGGDKPLNCPNAAAAFGVDPPGTDTSAEERSTVKATRRFVDACAHETGRRHNQLALYNTEQAIRDLEAFRAATKQRKLWIYSLSYGTQFSQTYATTFPSRVAALVLDGVVDLTVTGTQFEADLVAAQNKVLDDALSTCDRDEACRRDLGAAASSFDAVAAAFAKGPVSVRFPLPSGRTEQRPLSRAAFDAVVSSSVSSPSSRASLLRAVAAAHRDDNWVPLLRQSYANQNVDPVTFKAGPPGAMSQGVFYSFLCNDYGRDEADAQASADAYMRQGDRIESRFPRTYSGYYGMLPCAFWPNVKGPVSRPAPFSGGDYPTIIVSSADDAAVPVAHGEAIFPHVRNAAIVTANGGSHVMYGRGISCLDAKVTSVLLDGKLPEARRSTCDAKVIADYAPLGPAAVSGAAQVPEALLAVDRALEAIPEYQYWDGEAPSAVGCDGGGTLAFEYKGDDVALTFHQCSFTKGLALDGAGTFSQKAERLTLQVRAALDSGVAGDVTYDRTKATVSVRGAIGGQHIDAKLTR